MPVILNLGEPVRAARIVGKSGLAAAIEFAIVFGVEIEELESKIAPDGGETVLPLPLPRWPR